MYLNMCRTFGIPFGPSILCPFLLFDLGASIESTIKPPESTHCFFLLKNVLEFYSWARYSHHFHLFFSPPYCFLKVTTFRICWLFSCAYNPDGLTSFIGLLLLVIVFARSCVLFSWNIQIISYYISDKPVKFGHPISVCVVPQRDPLGHWCGVPRFTGPLETCTRPVGGPSFTLLGGLGVDKRRNPPRLSGNFTPLFLFNSLFDRHVFFCGFNFLQFGLIEACGFPYCLVCLPFS